MYDIKSIEAGNNKINNIATSYFYENLNKNNNNSNKNNNNSNNRNNCSSISSQIPENNSINMPFRRRRIFNRQTCLISIMAAFTLGLSLGVFLPMVGISATTTTKFKNDMLPPQARIALQNKTALELDSINDNNNRQHNSFIPKHPVSDFPTIYEFQHQTSNNNAQDNHNVNHKDTHSFPEHEQQQQKETGDTNGFAVTFVKENKLPVEEVFRNAFHLEQDKSSIDTMIVKKLDANDGSIKEYRVQRTSDGMFRKGPERRISKPSVIEQVLSAPINNKNNNNKEKFDGSVNFVPINVKNSVNKQSHFDSSNSQSNHHDHNFIKDDIYWGDIVENAIPKGFNHDDTDNWNYYVQNIGIVKNLENGCGRMQNRLVIFNDGKRACARYRQNTDQIQGELFSFYLGQLLNLTNLAPSAASVIDMNVDTWSIAEKDIENAQWKSTRPVVLTKWLPDLEPAGIPIPFQPLERHLNKYDVWNITLSMMESNNIMMNQQKQQKQQNEEKHNLKDIQDQENVHDQKLQYPDLNNKNLNNYHYIQAQQQQPQHQVKQDKKGLLERLGANRFNSNNQSSKQSADSVIIDSSIDTQRYDGIILPINHNNNTIKNLTIHNVKDQSIINNSTIILNRLIELAQWSDLIVFDYLIANLDRVVNNLYNYQWNADIMAAPAHNLARQVNSQLLVFLDNESGLLHGYRLLKKYEAYHGLLLDNLCVFRQPTIKALENLRDFGPGQLLQELFERSTSRQVRDVLPSLPDKSIKILIDRIDRVLGQVQKCRDLFSDR